MPDVTELTARDPSKLPIRVRDGYGDKLKVLTEGLANGGHQYRRERLR